MFAKPADLDARLHYPPGSPGFYNTIHLSGDELSDALSVCENQCAVVLAIFRAHARSMTPSEVHEFGVKRGSKWLLTSCRRSISDLTKAGTLVKTEIFKDGPHGHIEHCWQLSEPTP